MPGSAQPQEKKRGMWMGHPLLSQDHEHDLHLEAALNEFERGLPRKEAEEKALQNYRDEHHARAAAHHFAGMKASHATGNIDDAKRHHAMYSLHVKALGEDPFGPVPESVRKYGAQMGQSDRQKHVYKFRGHDADEFLVQPVTKSELEVIDLRKAEDPKEILRRAVNASIANISLDPIAGELVDYLADKGGIKDPPPPEVKKTEPAPQLSNVQRAARDVGRTLDVLTAARRVLEQLQQK